MGTDEQGSARGDAQMKEVAKAIYAHERPASIALGIDLDGCIDEAPVFFQVLSKCWPGEVFVITYRDDLEKAKRDVERLGVRCTEVVLVNSFEQKAEEIAKRSIFVYFDDQDEILVHVPEGVTVFKIRNGGNYDFDERKWLYSATTGRKI